jgi:hypothetical protein
MKDKNQTKWDWYGACKYWTHIAFCLRDILKLTYQMIHVDADQGLLYHWVKYEKSDLTIIHYNRLQQWAEISADDTPILGPIPVTEVPAPHRNKTIGVIKKTADVISSCGGLRMKLKRDFHIQEHAPYCDFHHFTGANKPWLPWRRPENVSSLLKKIKDHTKIKDVTLWWYFWLDKVNNELALGLDIENFSAAR